MRALGAFAIDDGVERFDPFLGFGGVEVLVEDVVELIHGTSPRRRAPTCGECASLGESDETVASIR